MRIKLLNLKTGVFSETIVGLSDLEQFLVNNQQWIRNSYDIVIECLKAGSLELAQLAFKEIDTSYFRDVKYMIDDLTKLKLNNIIGKFIIYLSANTYDHYNFNIAIKECKIKSETRNYLVAIFRDGYALP
jgi:hypothetical protein